MWGLEILVKERQAENRNESLANLKFNPIFHNNELKYKVNECTAKIFIAYVVSIILRQSR